MREGDCIVLVFWLQGFIQDTSTALGLAFWKQVHATLVGVLMALT